MGKDLMNKPTLLSTFLGLALALGSLLTANAQDRLHQPAKSQQSGTAAPNDLKSVYASLNPLLQSRTTPDPRYWIEVQFDDRPESNFDKAMHNLRAAPISPASNDGRAKCESWAITRMYIAIAADSIARALHWPSR